MPIVHPATYTPHAAPRKRRRRHPLLILVCLLLIAAGVNYWRPVPPGITTLHLPPAPAVTQPAIDWPGAGQAAIGAQGYGVLATSGSQNEIATASTAKIITALCVLQKQPLAPGQTGPMFTVGAPDISIYNAYIAQDGSTVAVAPGEQLSEYQALEALMVPSANNIADSLVRWVFGSQSAYADYAANYLAQHGLTHTHIGTDASGFDPSTTSNATDLTKLGLLALQNPVLLTIAGQQQVTLPVAGRENNWDTVLGKNGITGLKTGNNDADGGAFVFTAVYQLGGQNLQLTGAVMGASSLDSALQAAVNLAGSVEHGFVLDTFAAAGQPVGTARTAWGASTPVVTTRPLQIVRWKSAPVTVSHHVQADNGTGIVGSVQLQSGQMVAETTLQLQHRLPAPSFWWRLTRH